MRSTSFSIRLLLAGMVLSLFGATACKTATVSVPAEDEQRRDCSAKVDALRTWLKSLGAEGDVPAELVQIPESDHYRDQPLPTMPLVPLEEPATPLPAIAIVSLHHGAVRFGDTTANAADGRAMDDVMQRVTKSSLSPGFGSGGVWRLLLHPAARSVRVGGRAMVRCRLSNRRRSSPRLHDCLPSLCGEDQGER